MTHPYTYDSMDSLEEDEGPELVHNKTLTLNQDDKEDLHNGSAFIYCDPINTSFRNEHHWALPAKQRKRKRKKKLKDQCRKPSPGFIVLIVTSIIVLILVVIVTALFGFFRQKNGTHASLNTTTGTLNGTDQTENTNQNGGSKEISSNLTIRNLSRNEEVEITATLCENCKLTEDNKYPVNKEPPVPSPYTEDDESSPDFKVRLSNGSYGVLEVLYRGQWGSVCKDGFSDEGCSVVCSQLNFGNKGRFIDYTVHHPLCARSSGPILLDDVICTGQEVALHECRRSEWHQHNCNHRDDVVCKCCTNDLMCKRNIESCPREREQSQFITK